jgi:hypothetical protein
MEPRRNMRTLSRTVVSTTAAAVICLALALPASAATLIEYRGETSAPSWNRVVAYVLKKDNGRRLLRFIAIRGTLTCEDASTQKKHYIIGIGPLGKDGSFEREITAVEFDDDTTYLRVDGTIGFRNGNGTALFNRAALTQDGMDAQLCTTGELTWTVDRVSAERVKPSAVPMPGGKTYLRVRALK